MKWDKQGAIKALDVGECLVCGKVKPVHVVVTLHGQKTMHIPCCSNDCASIVAEVVLEEQSRS